MTISREHFNLWATFKGFQPNELKGGFTDWFVLHSDADEFGNRHPLNESTVGRSTLVELGVKIPEIPKFVPENFKQEEAWTFSCAIPSCGIRFVFDKAKAVEHIKETKHAPVMEYISHEDRKVGHPNREGGVIFFRPRTSLDTQPLDYISDETKKSEFKKDVASKASEELKNILSGPKVVVGADKEARQDAECEIEQAKKVYGGVDSVDDKFSFRKRMEEKYPFLRRSKND